MCSWQSPIYICTMRSSLFYMLNYVFTRSYSRCEWLCYLMCGLFGYGKKLTVCETYRENIAFTHVWFASFKHRVLQCLNLCKLRHIGWSSCTLHTWAGLEWMQHCGHTWALTSVYVMYKFMETCIGHKNLWSSSCKVFLYQS